MNDDPYKRNGCLRWMVAIFCAIILFIVFNPYKSKQNQIEYNSSEMNSLSRSPISSWLSIDGNSKQSLLAFTLDMAKIRGDLNQRSISTISSKQGFGNYISQLEYGLNTISHDTEFKSYSISDASIYFMREMGWLNPESK